MAVDAFMKIDDLVGESADKERSKEIEVLSWSWGMSQLGSTHSGTGGGSGKVSVQDLSFVKKIDTTSPNIIAMCCSGKHYKEATLTLRKAGSKGPVNYLVIKMEELIISNYSTGGSGEGSEILHENVTLNFGKFMVTYTPQDKNGDALPKLSAGFDIAANTKHG